MPYLQKRGLKDPGAGKFEHIIKRTSRKKLRLRRTSLGLTQTQVAKAINVTFQQIQKYEKGTNGVSSARLLQLANFLKVPIKYFFEDYQDFKADSGKDLAKV